MARGVKGVYSGSGDEMQVSSYWRGGGIEGVLCIRRKMREDR